MAKKPPVRKPARAASLDEVKPSKADSLLRIETGDPFPREETENLASAEDAASKAPAKKASAKKAPPKKVAAKRPAAGDGAPKTGADPRRTRMHGETRYTYFDDRGLQSFAWLAPIVDAVHAKGRVRITSAVHAEGATTMHVVLHGHEPPYDLKPGLLLHVDVDDALSFDHVVIGRASADLVEEAAHALIAAMQPDEAHPANAVGRRADWYACAIDASERLSARRGASRADRE